MVDPDRTYVVKAGDTLSGIAHEHYGDGSETAWRRIYDANKATIGDDPNLIKPGQKLDIPPAPSHLGSGHEPGRGS